MELGKHLLLAHDFLVCCLRDEVLVDFASNLEGEWHLYLRVNRVQIFWLFVIIVHIVHRAYKAWPRSRSLEHVGVFLNRVAQTVGVRRVERFGLLECPVHGRGWVPMGT